MSVVVERLVEQEMLADLAELRRLINEHHVEEARRLVPLLAARWPDSKDLQHCANVLRPAEIVPNPPGLKNRSYRQEQRWLKQHACEHPGCWIAVSGDQLVAVGRLVDVWNESATAPARERSFSTSNRQPGRDDCPGLPGPAILLAGPAVRRRPGLYRYRLHGGRTGGTGAGDAGYGCRVVRTLGGTRRAPGDRSAHRANRATQHAFRSAVRASRSNPRANVRGNVPSRRGRSGPPEALQAPVGINIE